MSYIFWCLLVNNVYVLLFEDKLRENSFEKILDKCWCFIRSKEYYFVGWWLVEEVVGRK